MSKKIQKYQKKETGIATRNQLITEYSVNKCMRKYRHANTIEKAVEVRAPTLGTIRKNLSEDTVLAYIEMWLVSLNDFVNATRKMTPEQMQETAILIFQDYPYLKLSDINLIFTKAKKGDFGKIYESLDGMKILQWFKDYTEERAETVFNRGMHEHDRHKKEQEKGTRQKEQKRIDEMMHEIEVQKMKDKFLNDK